MLSSVTIFNPGQVTDAFIMLFGIEPSVPEVREVIVSERDREIKEIAESITAARLRETVSVLSGLGSRVPGYAGHRKAADFIRSELEQIGLQGITEEAVEVTVPVDKGASLVVASTGEEIQLFGLWPNQVRTPSLPDEGVTGILIYGGRGSFKELNGKPVKNSIVLMEFDSDQNYLNPRMLGAHAVIFYDNGRVTQGQALQKFLQVPVDVPRLWVGEEQAKRLLNLAQSGDHQVVVKARMDWERVSAPNIYGIIPGADEYISERRERKWKDEIILVSAFYDAISVVPGVAPGAESAANVAALLETARALRRNPPKYTVMVPRQWRPFRGARRNQRLSLQALPRERAFSGAHTRRGEDRLPALCRVRPVERGGSGRDFFARHFLQSDLANEQLREQSAGPLRQEVQSVLRPDLPR